MAGAFVINWFGPESWGAAINEAPRCDVPVGMSCFRCTKAFCEGDNGVTMPGSYGPVAFHRSCHLKMMIDHTLWPQFHLIPDEADGLVNERFECECCGMVYTTAQGWSRRAGGSKPPSTIEWE